MIFFHVSALTYEKWLNQIIKSFYYTNSVNEEGFIFLIRQSFRGSSYLSTNKRAAFLTYFGFLEYLKTRKNSSEIN